MTAPRVLPTPDVPGRRSKERTVPNENSQELHRPRATSQVTCVRPRRKRGNGPVVHML